MSVLAAAAGQYDTVIHVTEPLPESDSVRIRDVTTRRDASWPVKEDPRVIRLAVRLGEPFPAGEPVTACSMSDPW